MKKLLYMSMVILLSARVNAQDPQDREFACFGGSVIIDSSGVGIVHHVRSNVFPTSHFIREFDGSLAEWADLENKAIAAADKQLKEMGYNVPIIYPSIRSNYPSEQKTQEALDVWNSRTPPDILLQFK